MPNLTQKPFILRDGLNLALFDWPVQPKGAPRGVVLIVHGLGEHAWRYDAMAERLSGWGFHVRAYDQRGHGESGGLPGVLPDDDALLDDLQEIIEDTQMHMSEPWECPLILLGHSMGGLIAATLVQRGLAQVDLLVLSSPALDAGIGAVQKLLIRALKRLAPNFTLPNGLDVQGLSHDPAVVAAYQTDPLVHGRISARLADFIDSNGPKVVAAAPTWRLPTLLLYAELDRLVRPEGSRAFAAGAPPDVVISRCLKDQFHEIFNEADPSQAYDELHQWLAVQAPQLPER